MILLFLLLSIIHEDEQIFDSFFQAFDGKFT